MSPSGVLIMRDLLLHDVGASADRPLVAIHELRATSDGRICSGVGSSLLRFSQIAVYARPIIRRNYLCWICWEICNFRTDRSSVPF